MALWCDNQYIDSNGDVVCMAHLVEDRVLDCPYKTLRDRLRAQYPCSDYEERRSSE